jgi:class 3 adenylate cyclase
VVNLAARAAKAGSPGTILVPGEVAAVIGMPSESIGTVELRGIGPVELFSLRRGGRGRGLTPGGAGPLRPGTG